MTTRSILFIPLPLGVFGLGSTELIIILVAILIVFGPSTLPKLADAMGKAIRNFKKSVSNEEEASEAKPVERVTEKSTSPDD